MQLVVATEQRFMAQDDAVYAEGLGGHTFWTRYLDGFDSVCVLARIEKVTRLPASAVRADGPGVRFYALPYYVGALGALLHLPQTVWRVGRCVRPGSAYMLRVPGVIATLLFGWLTARRLPYAVEVVGDPHDSLSHNALGTWWSDVVRWPLVQLTKQICARAIASSYVTRETLQRRYPNRAGQYTTHYSSLTLEPELTAAFGNASLPAMVAATPGVPLRLIFVGSLAQRYKGLHVLLAALAHCLADGYDLTLDVLGDGSYRRAYEAEARAHGVAERVHFHGMVTRQQVFDHLQRADLFVMPSLVEGLPRAMIEAMAFGLPCIGSDVGGIPELLGTDLMVPPGDSAALAAKIAALYDDLPRRALLGATNRALAAEYRADVLQARRKTYYTQVRQLTEQRQRRRPTHPLHRST